MPEASLDRTLAALADPSRRRVVDLLRKGPRSAGELAGHVRLSPPAMSRHLRILRRRGLIEETRGSEDDNRLRIYCLRREPFSELSNWTRGLETMWSDQLAGFKALAENKVQKTSRKGRRA
jgi:DNA-binding transcriptional ArsR family regulator